MHMDAAIAQYGVIVMRTIKSKEWCSPEWRTGGREAPSRRKELHRPPHHLTDLWACSIRVTKAWPLAAAAPPESWPHHLLQH